MVVSTRLRLISSFLGVSLLGGTLSLVIGARLIQRAVFREALARVTQDLNVAGEIYSSRVERIATGLGITGLDGDVQSAIGARDPVFLGTRISEIAAELELDFAGVVDAEGRLISSLHGVERERIVTNLAVTSCLERRSAVSGSVVLDAAELADESPELARLAVIDVIPTPKAAPSATSVENRGLTITAAAPVWSGGRLAGAVYGGVLLNRNADIVDTVRDTVFHGETLDGRQIGTATIFLHDVRVATNVMFEDGRRAIGTRVSREVKERVLDRGGSWADRAFVVSSWYVSAYEPIVDVKDSIVGILYTGVLEGKFSSAQRETVAIFALLTLGGVAVSVTLGSLLGDRLLRPIHELIALSTRVSQGDLTPRVQRVSRSEIGQLQLTFNRMLVSLSERESRQKEASDTALLQSERQASVGRLAAGVAHEINNPLTGTLTFTHLLLRRTDLPPDVHSDLEVIARSTARVRDIVRGLLDFSRQTQLRPEPIDVNDLVKTTLALVENQALVKGVELRFDPGPGLPRRTLDRSQMQSVIMNIVLNALDATEAGGVISVSTSVAVTTETPGEDGGTRAGIQIVVSDTGCGIPPENLGRLFDPFFTTKEVGKGTGLGLSVSLGIVEKHGGTIRVSSTVGRGSTFEILLPLDEGRHGQ